jgi:hypothetical protein
VKLTTSEATAGAVLLGLVAVLLVLCISLGLMAVGGVIVAWAWNTLLVPNVTAELPVILWWQAALGILAVRFVIGLCKN